MPISYGQFVAVQVATYFSSSLSTIGSATIVTLILRRRCRKQTLSIRQSRRHTEPQLMGDDSGYSQQSSSISLSKLLQDLPPYEWIMLLLSLGDMIVSFSYLLAPFAIPEGTPGAYWAVGNTSSCSAFGLIAFFGSQWVAGWNCFLSIYFLLTVRYSWKDKSDFTTRVKWGAFSFVLLLPTATSINGFIQKSYNFSSNTYSCIMGDLPDGCSYDPDVECIRGENGSLAASLYVGVLSLFSLTGFICTFTVYWTVRTFTKRSLRHVKHFRTSVITLFENLGQSAAASRHFLVTNGEESETGQQSILTEPTQPTLARRKSDQSEASRLHSVVESMTQSQQERLRQTAWQAIFYSLAYLNVMIWPFVTKITHEQQNGQTADHQHEPASYSILLLSWVFYPLQGFLNFFIFIRLDFRRWRTLNPQATRWWIFKQCVLHAREPIRRDPTETSIRSPDSETGSNTNHHHENPAPFHAGTDDFGSGNNTTPDSAHRRATTFQDQGGSKDEKRSISSGKIDDSNGHDEGAYRDVSIKSSSE